MSLAGNTPSRLGRGYTVSTQRLPAVFIHSDKSEVESLKARLAQYEAQAAKDLARKHREHALMKAGKIREVDNRNTYAQQKVIVTSRWTLAGLFTA